MIIAVEGLDGVGKTRLARALAKTIDGFYVRALDRAAKHELMATTDPHAQAEIVYASLAPKAWHCRRLARPCVFDRYAYSLAYQVALGMDVEEVVAVLRRLPRPDAVFYVVGGRVDMPGVDAGSVSKWFTVLLERVPPRSLVLLDEEMLQMMSIDEVIVYAARLYNAPLHRYINGIDVIEVALMLVERGVVSSTLAARIAGMSILEFVEEARKRGHTVYSVEKLFE